MANPIDMDALALENLQLTAHIEQTPKELTKEGWGIPVGDIREYKVEETGHNTPVKIYYPEGEGPFPFLFYVHGGAYITGWALLDEPLCRAVCHDAGCAVVSPTYVLAPQFPWPAALNELYALLRHLVHNAYQYNLDSSRVAIGGSSAGGNFTLALCTMIHEKRESSVSYGVFVYPTIDLDQPAEEKVNSLTDIKVVSLEYLSTVTDLYVPEGVDRKNPLISPFYGDPAALPPLCLFSARRDILFTEQQAFANKPIDAGHDVLYRCYANTGHGFLEIAGGEDTARDCKALIASQLKRVFCSV